MQGNSKGSVGPFIKLNYIGHVQESMQDYSKGSVGPLIMVH
jgi:hypothetical protein